MTNFEREEFQKLIPVSHETMDKLDRYVELLTEWNLKFNLVAASTIPHIWQRHFLDSAQICKFIPSDTKIIADMGSGAGFPGLVLAILGANKVHLIESTGKKANFLQTVIDDLKLENAVIRQERAENIRDLKADVVTARACSSLLDLLNWAIHLINKDGICIFPKGQNADVELTESAKYWRFDCEKKPSISDPSGSVLILKDIENAARKIKPRTR